MAMARAVNPAVLLVLLECHQYDNAATEKAMGVRARAKLAHERSMGVLRRSDNASDNSLRIRPPMLWFTVRTTRTLHFPRQTTVPEWIGWPVYLGTAPDSPVIALSSHMTQKAGAGGVEGEGEGVAGEEEEEEVERN